MRNAILLTLALSLPVNGAAFDEFRVYAVGGKSTTTWHGQADVHAVSFEMGRALSPRTTFAVVVSPMTMWQPRSWFGDDFGDGNESVKAIHGALLLRRTFRTRSRVQWYLDGSTGPMFAEKRVPASTSRFNFATRAGAGVVLNANGRIPVILGYQFLHISNGGYAPRNPGLNISAGVVGVQLKSARLRRR